MPENILFIILGFDFFVCIFLLIDWAKDLYKSQPKSVFLKKPSTWVSLIASIPLQVLLPIAIPGINVLRYFRLLKLLRVLILFDVLWRFGKFCKKEQSAHNRNGSTDNHNPFYRNTLHLWLIIQSFWLFLLCDSDPCNSGIWRCCSHNICRENHFHLPYRCRSICIFPDHSSNILLFNKSSA